MQPLPPEDDVLLDQTHQGRRLGGVPGLGGEAVQLQLQLPSELVEVILSQLYTVYMYSQVRSGHSTNLRSVVRVATGVGTRRHVLAVGGVDVGDEAVLGHHPVELLQAAARVGVLQVEQEGAPVPVSPGELSLRNIDYIHPVLAQPRSL